ncbi:MAG: class I SAM-dependent methyltransferase [Candidatus Marinimicrobia bacterium]|nr:class I SAM-dependent methyltransferase [Candidatus Neomarinimicrobiota bacterium]
MSKFRKLYYDLDQDIYLGEDYYDGLAAKKNPLQSFIHKKRYVATNDLVHQYYRPGMTLVDFACGNCTWNEDKLPVVGVDYSHRVIKYALKKHRLKQAICEDIAKKTNLTSNSVDLLVVTETLEHFPKLDGVMKEIYRVLKPKGKLIVSVPYDSPLSLWWPLFAILCFYQGRILGKELYKNQCGHVQHSNPKSLKRLLEKHGFSLIKQFSTYRFILFMAAEKK